MDVYYKKREGGRTVLHYCKYVDDEVLFATENGDGRQNGRFEGPYAEEEEAGAYAETTPGRGFSDNAARLMEGLRSFSETARGPAEAETSGGLYEDGRYPFVFDPLWPVKGSPCGYGYVDLCRNPQMMLDIMDSDFLQNFHANVLPRYFARIDGNVNEEEFLNWQKPIVHVSGNVDETNLSPIRANMLSGNYINVYQQKVSELRETSGNTESANGVYSSGVTAASAIAAMQEASGKTSRDASRASYRVYSEIVDMAIERVRQFYTMPRTFRIKGSLGEVDFRSYDNSGLRPRSLGRIGSEDMGLRKPVFDLEIVTQKKNMYTRTAQNELILNLFDRGMFNPQFATQALAVIGLMDFDGKESFLQVIGENGTLFEQFQKLGQYVLELLQTYEPEKVQPMQEQLSQIVPLAGGGGGPVDLDRPASTGESGIVERARARANRSASPGA